MQARSSSALTLLDVQAKSTHACVLCLLLQGPNPEIKTFTRIHNRLDDSLHTHKKTLVIAKMTIPVRTATDLLVPTRNLNRGQVLPISRPRQRTTSYADIGKASCLTTSL